MRTRPAIEAFAAVTPDTPNPQSEKLVTPLRVNVFVVVLKVVGGKNVVTAAARRANWKLASDELGWP